MIPIQQSVSNRKPPLCPNRQQNAVVPVHNTTLLTSNSSNSNNRLFNTNSNNHCTFNNFNKLTRDNGGVGGYTSQTHLDHSYSSTTLASAYGSGYGIGNEFSGSYTGARSHHKPRTAKSDVGAPISRYNHTASLQHKIFPKSTSTNIHAGKQVLSPSEHNAPYSFGSATGAANNNHTATLPYHISGGVPTADYLENYKTGFKHFYNGNTTTTSNAIIQNNNNNNSYNNLSRLDVNNHLHQYQSQQQQSSTSQQPQQQMPMQQQHSTANDNSNGGIYTSNINNNNNNHLNIHNNNNSSNGGPLLYLDTDLIQNQRNMNNGVKNYRNQNVSKLFKFI